MKIAAIIFARMASTRLKHKALAEVAGRPMLAHVIARALRFPKIESPDDIVLAIPDKLGDDVLEEFGRLKGVNVFRGDEDDVLSRMTGAAESVHADVVYRVTGDNPLVDPNVASYTWQAFSVGGWDYTVMEKTPLGTTAEIVTRDALLRADKLAVGQRFREHPTLALYEYNMQFRINLVQSPDKWRRPDWRLTVDSAADLSLVENIMCALGADATLDQIVPFLDEHPELVSLNASVAQQGWAELKEKKDEIGGV